MIQRSRDLDKIIITALNKTIQLANVDLNRVGIGVMSVQGHLLDRMSDREIYPEDVNRALQILFSRQLCQLLYECEHTNRQFVKFMIQFDELFFIHGTYAKIPDKQTKIAFRTVVKYRASYVPDDILIKVKTI